MTDECGGKNSNKTGKSIVPFLSHKLSLFSNSFSIVVMKMDYFKSKTSLVAHSKVMVVTIVVLPETRR